MQFYTNKSMNIKFTIKLPVLFLFCILLFSCDKSKKTQNEKDSKNKIEKSEVDDFNKKLTLNVKESKERMLKKGISFETLGDCDNSISEKTTSDLIITKESITKSTLNVDFKFLQACCQTFGGDYKIKNDTLIFEYENVGEGICTCECWYKYKLKIRDIEGKFTSYKLIQK